MNIHRIKAIILQEYFMTVRNLETINDIFIYPIMNIVVFGFITKYLMGSSDNPMFVALVVGMLFWQVFSTAQYTMSVATLWNMWAHNMTNLFASPISLSEYFFAHAFTAFIKSSLVFALGSLIIYFQFGFNIVSFPLLLTVIIFLNLFISGISLGLVLIGIIFLYGTRIQALTWGFVSLIQPLSAVFYPLSILPVFLQTIGRIIPLTYMFEALRQYIKFKYLTSYSLNNLMIGSMLTSLYLLLSILVFSILFTKSKEIGQLPKNDQ